MLLDAIGISASQADIARAAGAEQTIDQDGTRVDQLALACSRIAPQTQFWYKYHSSLDDIRYLLSRGYIIGVEWQGLFYESEEEEDDDDHGHYSVISHLDEERQAFIIVDPYKDFSNQSRIFEVATFLRRWWDTNDIPDPITGRKKLVEDVRLLFFITPLGEFFPPERNFKPFSSLDLGNWYQPSH
jgi:hypothetical protein